MYNFRTDMADERRDIYKKANKLESEIDGIESTKEEKDENIKIERVKIVNESGEKAIGKPIGNYITIDIKKLKIARRRWNPESIRNINRRIKKNHRLTCW